MTERKTVTREELIGLIEKFCDPGEYGSGSSDPEGLADAIVAALPEGLREALNEAADYIADVATDSDGMEVDGFFLVEKLRALAAALSETSHD